MEPGGFRTEVKELEKTEGERTLVESYHDNFLWYIFNLSVAARESYLRIGHF